MVDRRLPVLAAIAALLALAGCASDEQADAAPTSAADATALLADVECAAATDAAARTSELVPITSDELDTGVRTVTVVPAAGEREPLPVDATIVAAARCDLVVVEDPGTFVGFAGYVPRTVTGDLDALAEALHAANEAAEPADACTDVLDPMPNVWVVTADGDLLAPAWPADGCGQMTRIAPESVLADDDLAAVDLATLQPIDD